MTESNDQNSVQAPVPDAPRKDLSKIKLGKLLKLGKRHYEQQDWGQAAPYYVEAWNREPENNDLLVIVAFLLTKLGVRAQAIGVLEKALEVNGPTKDILGIVGEMASNMDMFDVAEKIYSIHVGQYPEDPQGYVNLASVLGSQHRYDESVSLLQQVIPNFPEFAPLWNVLGAHVKIAHGLEQSNEFLKEALRLEPKNLMTLNNLGMNYHSLGQFEESIACSENALEIDPNHYEPRLGLGISQIASGNIKEGFENYEARNDPRRPGAVLYQIEVPTWQGESLEGKSIVVLNEQGLGDEFLFANNFQAIYEQAEKLYITCDSRCIPLYQRSFPNATVTYSGTTSKEGYLIRGYPELIKAMSEDGLQIDYKSLAGSLPRYLWDSVADIPAPEEGWLKADPERVAHWKAELDKLDHQPKIGIVWRSGKRDVIRDTGYTDILDWEKVLRTKGVTFVCLQYDECQEELDEAKEKFGVDIWYPEGLDQRNDIDDTCALLTALDAVVGPATTPAMMANAVGTPVWWLLRGRPWWMYGETETCPISPKGRVFMIGVEDDWKPLFDDVAKSMEEFAQSNQ